MSSNPTSTQALSNQKALAGTKVLEVASYVTGPYAGMLLADMGAEVVKVEDPETGDQFRRWGQQLYSPTFCAFNRNKRSIVLDLRTTAGRELAFRLASQADVLIENFRPGVMERLGLGYEAVRAVNPAVIYCSISGFGQEGPYSGRPGYDTLGQAISGLLSLLTDLDQPQGMGISLSDHITGVFACYGILVALLARHRTGLGQRVDTSLLQATVSFTGENAARFFASGKVPDRKARVRLAQVYAVQARDGLPFVIHLSSPPKFWIGLTDAIGMPELQEDPRFATSAGREKHYEELSGILTEVFRRRNRDEWLQELQSRDVPSAPVYTVAEVFDDPQVRHLKLEAALHHPQMGTWRTTSNPVRLSETPPTYHLPAPLLGEHTAVVLRELGLGPQEIEALRVQGAFGTREVRAPP